MTFDIVCRSIGALNLTLIKIIPNVKDYEYFELNKSTSIFTEKTKSLSLACWLIRLATSGKVQLKGELIISQRILWYGTPRNPIVYFRPKFYNGLRDRLISSYTSWRWIITCLFLDQRGNLSKKSQTQCIYLMTRFVPCTNLKSPIHILWKSYNKDWYLLIN